MSKTTDSIIRIVQTGVDLEISAESKTVDGLIKIVESLRPNQKLTIRDCGDKTTDGLMRIANAGKVKLVL